jgi:agmatine/peptidylarginine deiminase
MSTAIEGAQPMPRVPAEWEPQGAVMLTWPHADTDWSDQLERVEHLYADLAAQISRHEPVLIVCRDEDLREHVRKLLASAGVVLDRSLYAVADSNDTWARDHGPITVVDGVSPRLVDFRFNGWGGKFPAACDNRITGVLHAAGRFPGAGLVTSPMVLEGGAIEVDGAGTLLAVTRTLVDERRNPGWSATRIEVELQRLLGISRFLWLEHGQLTGDDTDGHIDTLARFCSRETICYVRCEDRADSDYPELAAMEQELLGFARRDDEPYRLVPLPHPAPIRDADGRRLAASYANFLIINAAVLLPVYADAADETAYRVLQALFPDREIVPIDCRPLIHQGGSLHCVTMQLPAALTIG